MDMADPVEALTPRNERGRAILCVCIACGILETVAVALRFLARRKMKARFQIDDWLIFASLWPNYSMIVTGSISEHSLLSISTVEALTFTVVGEGKAGLPTGALTAHQMVVFLKVGPPLYVL